MPPKKATGAAPKAKTSSTPAHGSYKDMIKEAIMALKERNGSSRSALKKYILANNANVSPGTAFDNQFNRAIKSGAEKQEFQLPKGPSGTVKLMKKEAAAPKTEKPAKKPAAAAKTTTTKTKAAAPKKVGAPKKTATKTATKAKAPKKAPATKAKAAPKPKANTSTKRAKSTPSSAPAIVDEKKVLGKTKSGRVTKGPAKPSNPQVKKTPKKAAPKKAASAKKATPKKAEAPAAAA